MAVTHFRNEHFFLSNMYPFERGIQTPDGAFVNTSEQLYLPAKYLKKGARLAIQEATNGYRAKKLTRVLEKAGFEKRHDWDQVKVPIMKKCVAVKFVANPDLAEKLLRTGEQELIEGNNRGDTFWGVHPMKPEDTEVPQGAHGENMLGNILMETRAKLNSGELQVGRDVEKMTKEIYQPAEIYQGLGQ